ncbi:MAG: 1-acyl-sn-glycerol-3-phosphate acyltransferase, partial [Flavobacteriales bacterium]|nr:1-acyl-sn-glycerol-3-phosphate acyltransferase [Flavobacteriales bacterium]
MKKIFLVLFYGLLVRPWLTILIGVGFYNKKTFDSIDQFIVVANHNSHFDSISILAALPLNKLANTHPVAAMDYFGKTSLSAGVVSLFVNTLLIRRKKEDGGASPIELIDGYLKKGKSIILFPEGSRGKPGVIEDFKKGIAILLQKNPSIPFVPVYLDGFGRVLPKDRKLIIPLNCKVRFGEPIWTKGKDIEAILTDVKDAILSLKSN